MRPRPLSTRSPRGPLSPEARSCAARGGRGVVYGVVCHMYTPHPPQGGVGGCTVAYHPVPHHPATPRLAGMGLWAHGPRGARGQREYTGIPGNTRNTREYPGIPGNTRNTRKTREYTEYTGIPGDTGITREYTGIHGNTRDNTGIHGNTREYTGTVYLWSFLIAFGSKGACSFWSKVACSF